LAGSVLALVGKRKRHDLISFNTTVAWAKFSYRRGKCHHPRRDDAVRCLPSPRPRPVGGL